MAAADRQREQIAAELHQHVESRLCRASSALAPVRAGAGHGDAAAALEVDRRDGAIHATVADDGRGGADPHGSGLQGLADRLAALGGRLRVDSPRGAGTTVTAILPPDPATAAEPAHG